MAVIGELAKALGAGMKVYAATVSVADGDTVDTGLKTVLGVVLTTSNAAHIAAVTGVSGGTITVGLEDNGGTAVTTAEDVYVVAFGQ